MKKQLFIWLAVAMLLPSAVAFNCNSLSGGDLHVCNSIQGTNLSQADKDLFIADIFNQNKTSPNFDFVYSWNTNLNIKDSPDGKIYSSGAINNAWVKIIALMPSVIENNTLYSSGKGKLMTSYDYKINLPSGTEYGDCKTEYSLSNQNENLNIYLNDHLIGHEKLNSFNINSEGYETLGFRSELNIQSAYRVEHYRWKTEHYRKVCKYSSTEYRTDNLRLTDNLNAKVYKNTLESSFKITEEYYNITKGVLEANNFTKLTLSFNNSFYQDSEYIYSLDYALPYYVLTLKAEKVKNIAFNNIHVDKYGNTFNFNVKDTSDCKIKLADHFNSITKNCDLSFNETNISIKTDKTNYYGDDIIQVYVYPSDLVVNVTYANQTRLVKNYTEFRAVLYENKISAELNNKEVDLFVNVTKKEDIEILFNLGILSFFGFFFYKSAKVYYLNFNF